MKTALTIICTIFTLCLFSQDKKSYNAKGIFREYWNSKTNTLITKQTIGKDVNITHDVFFNSWLIRYTNEDGKKIVIKLKYVQGDAEGSLFRDESELKWFVTDEIKQKKQLFLALDTPDENGVWNTYVISDIRDNTGTK